jgi:ribosomal protein L37AE/L43A
MSHSKSDKHLVCPDCGSENVTTRISGFEWYCRDCETDGPSTEADW